MYSRGDIVMIPVPFTDLSASKRRPVLVISNDAYNTADQDMIVVAITSNLAQTGIPITDDGMEQGQIPKPSVIRSGKVYTLKQDIVVKSIGRVKDAIVTSVYNDIIKHIS